LAAGVDRTRRAPESAASDITPTTKIAQINMVHIISLYQ
jgi:hypothetical protein